MDQDTRPQNQRRGSSDGSTSDTGQSAPLRVRPRDIVKGRGNTTTARASANTYLDKLLQRVTTTVSNGLGQTAPIATSGVLYDRCVVLVQSLGDPDNPAHIHAAEELVAMGPAALPALTHALSPESPWLISYRAAEILGEIGDRRASQPLIDALSHPNSNVRWSVIRSLSVVGNTRALFALRRIARDDRSKTTWGESIAGVAQSAIDQMQGHNLLVKAMEILKTVISTVVLLLALVLAWNVFERVRGEVSAIGVQPTATVTADEAAILPGDTSDVATTETPTVLPTQALTELIRGTIINPGNVRAEPAIGNNVIGQVVADDEVVYLATTPDRTWFKVQLGANRSAQSSIGSVDGIGWINQSLVSPPTAALPIEDILLPTRVPAMTATPEPVVEEATATAESAPVPEVTATVDPLLPPTPTP
ncbi:MAG: HEAT repeat domain-containing protein [Roseiflexaceae bacterium]